VPESYHCRALARSSKAAALESALARTNDYFSAEWRRILLGVGRAMKRPLGSGSIEPEHRNAVISSESTA